MARERFEAALGTLVERVKRDKSVLAAVLCGSLSHDTVWEKSDIDLLLVTIDEKARESSLPLWADGINVHAMLMTRTEFRKAAEGAVRNSFTHSFLAKGRLLYTHDGSIARMCESLQRMGDRDRQIALLGAACGALAALYKAHKWLV